MEQRKHFIDNLRWLCILLLVPYHGAMAYNCWGEANYIHFEQSKAFSAFITAISPWYMALLFVLAGMSASYSLAKRSHTAFIRERGRKLLIPVVLGIFSIVPVMAYCADVFWNGYKGNFFEHYGVFFTRFTDLSGYDGGFTPGHLWFLLYLFVISFVALGVIFFEKRFIKGRIRLPCNYFTVCLLGILPALTKPILDINGKSLGEFLALFLLGYFLFSEEAVLSQIKKYRLFSLVFFLAANIGDVYLYLWSDRSGDWLNVVFRQITLWSGILVALGYGARYLDFANKQTKWLSGAAFSFYLWHYMYLIVGQLLLSGYTDSGLLLFVLPVAVSYFAGFVTLALMKRIAAVRKRAAK